MSQEQVTTSDVSNMSDAEFSQLDLAGYIAKTAEGNSSTTEENTSTDDYEDSDEVTEDTYEGEYEEDTEDEEEYSEENQLPESKRNSNSNAYGGDEVESNEPSGTLSERSKAEAYDMIMGDFKAANKTMSVASPEDALQLMQMGVDYRRKMMEIKPARKSHKLLEDNGIDESTLSFLIDVYNKRPEALAKLLQDSGLETYELDEDMANNYTPNHYSVSDNSLALDDVINDLSQNDEGNQVLSIVSSVWDEESRRYFGTNPKDMYILQNHISDGTFKMITDIMERERVMGRLEGMSDIDAYRTVGTHLASQGSLPAVKSQRKQPIGKRSSAKKEVSNASRKAAAAPSSIGKSSAPAINYLAMSDEEFKKLGSVKFK